MHAYDGFPSEMCVFPDVRIPVRSAKNYLKLLHMGYDKTTCFIRFHPDAAYLEDGSMMVNKMVADLDWDKVPKGDIALVYDEMRGIVRYFQNRYGYTPRVNFSGSRGFHVWIDFKPVQIDRYIPVAKSYWMPLVENLKLLCFDTDITYDKNRQMRIPYTINVKSSNWCRPIDPTWSIQQIKNPPFFYEHKLGCCPRIDQELKMLDKVEQKAIEGTTSIEFTPHDNKEKKYAQYVDEMARVFHLSRGYANGRHRTLWCIIVPRLAYVYSDGNYSGDGASMKPTLNKTEKLSIEQKVLATAMDWIERTPLVDQDGTPRKKLSNYSDYIKAILKQIFDNGYSPWGITRFLNDNPDLVRYWVA